MFYRGARGARLWGTIVGWGGAALACIYLVNGLTRSDATVRVRLDPQAALAQDPGLTHVESVGMFYFSDLEGGERIVARLGLVLFWVVVAALGFMLARQARSRSAVGPRWFVVPSADATVIAVLVACLGFLPSLGDALASSAVLRAAGMPEGLQPYLMNVQLGWVAAGIGYATLVHAGRRQPRGTLTVPAAVGTVG
ncbi:hypothetical protein KIN34_01740 [Cellulomonas sp. DKR-3]|uniref:Uncharacterized protein n=1 Tax=Cellulomonas fulva TaxID=2835530 RepID=A0ABS5TV79_9CELL|nr:hypothetical protein [Cellulomonas fulva]MBT0993013.1 hypothetical protein [Cellulomonas fulva]